MWNKWSIFSLIALRTVQSSGVFLSFISGPLFVVLFLSSSHFMAYIIQDINLAVNAGMPVCSTITSPLVHGFITVWICFYCFHTSKRIESSFASAPEVPLPLICSATFRHSILPEGPCRSFQNCRMESYLLVSLLATGKMESFT